MQQRSSVVFPAPFGPSTAVSAPGRPGSGQAVQARSPPKPHTQLLDLQRGGSGGGTAAV